MPEAHLVVGLGNPGREYERTRHNLGFRVVDALAERFGLHLRKGRANALVADLHDDEVWIVLAKPLTYMNLSGEAVQPLARFFKIPPERIIAVHDEIDLPFGIVRVKAGGGTAGHHGLDSLVQMLSTPGFARVRLGVGRPPGRKEGAGHVLRPLGKRREAGVAVMIEEAADAVMAIVREGVASAQNRHNPRKAAD